MAENFYTVLTNAGMAAFANAQVSQGKVDFANIAVGDSNGAYYNPVATATKLVNEVWRGPINSISIDEANPNWLIVEAVIPAIAGGFSVREIGVFDTAGTLLAVGKVPETYKPAAAQGSLKDLYLRMILEVSNASAVTLKVDPAVIFASKKYVDDKVASISQNTTQIINNVGNINDLEVESVANVVQAVNKVNKTLTKHLEEKNPHGITSEMINIVDRTNLSFNTPPTEYPVGITTFVETRATQAREWRDGMGKTSLGNGFRLDITTEIPNATLFNTMYGSAIQTLHYTVSTGNGEGRLAETYKRTSVYKVDETGSYKYIWGPFVKQLNFDGGEMKGILTGFPNTSYTARQFRNSILSPTDPTVEMLGYGEICYVYKE